MNRVQEATNRVSHGLSIINRNLSQGWIPQVMGNTLVFVRGSKKKTYNITNGYLTREGA